MDFIRTIVISLLLVLNIIQTNTEYEMYVRFYSLSNPSGLLPEGRCCDSEATDVCTIIQNLCDLQVYVCQRPLETRVSRNFVFDIESDCGSSSVSSSFQRDSLQLEFNDSFLALDNPIALDQEVLPENGIQLLIGVVDRDGRANNLIDRIPILVLTQNITVVDNETRTLSITRQNYSGVFNLSTVELSIELICNEEYNGDCSRCSPACTCNNCPCPLGFTGDDCSIDINECEDVTCNGRGECVDLVGSFQCQCEPGFEGEECEMRSGLKNYQLTVRVLSVDNSNHSLADSTCTKCCDKFSLLCDTSVQYCVRPIGSVFSNTTNTDIDTQCSNYLRYRSQVYEDMGGVNFETTNDPIQRNIITNLQDPSEGFQIYLEVLDDDIQFDSEDVNELVDRFVFDMKLTSGANFVIENQEGLFAKATVNLNLEASCSSGYSGSFCTVSPMRRTVIGLTSSVSGVVLVIIVAVVIAVISYVIARNRRRRKLKQNLSITSDNVYNELGSEYHELHHTAMMMNRYTSSMTNEFSVQSDNARTPRKTKTFRNSIEYDYAEADHNIILTRKQSMDYNALYWSPSNEEGKLKVELDELSLKTFGKDELEIMEVIGSGEFSHVHQALWHHSDGRDVWVAVKATKEGATEDERIKFLQEAAIMGQFDHPYIITIFGVMVDSMKHHIVVELMIGGSLLDHLHNMERNQDRLKLGSELLCYSKQIANGMSYLELRGFIHRDLACRNVLLNKNNICKIADFGLSRDLNKDEQYVSSGGKIPLKWTAPEAILHGTCSSASDVWSYGIVLFEIWSLGARPYEHVAFNQFMMKLSNGYRLLPPPGCPRDIYSTMILCWHPNSDLRPKFVNIVTILNRPEYLLLTWSDEDKTIYSEKAMQIGAMLEAGENLYLDLQHQYLNNNVMQPTV